MRLSLIILLATIQFSILMQAKNSDSIFVVPFESGLPSPKLLFNNNLFDGNKKVNSKKSKYQFAQFLFGLSMQYTPANGKSTLLQNNGTVDYAIGGFYTPRLMIGGTHFYGHADFCINFPLGNYGKKNNTIDYAFEDFDIITAKYYPWAIQQHKLRPFIGSAFNITSFKQTGTGTYSNYWSGTDFRLNFPINIGLSYKKGKNLLLLDAKINTQTKRQIFADRTATVGYQMPSSTISLTVLKMLETTAPMFEKLYNNGSLDKKYEATKKQLNAFSFGVGLSSSFYTNSSNYNIAKRPYLNNTVSAILFPEFALGYYLDKQDVHFNVAYRNISASKSALGMVQNYDRKAITLEGFKFLMDYKGFVPFVGLGISKEQLQFSEKEFGQATIALSQNMISSCAVFGWDIRYHRNYILMLRTNMRYYPFLQLDSKDASIGKINFNQLEINFIQAVFYPQRLQKKLRYNR
jgi:hypothetical protein